jgi:hypothetical protein
VLKIRERKELLRVLDTRFTKNMHRHSGIKWSDVKIILEGNLPAMQSLFQMEATGGEPDVIGQNDKGRYTFCDCCAESPAGRRNVCYDGDARESRKEHKPMNSACELAKAMGIDILTEQQYRGLQRLGEFDLKTSSWVSTPPDVRELGGALFCDRRFGKVFVYHNGAQSYYAGRGFRGLVLV